MRLAPPGLTLFAGLLAVTAGLMGCAALPGPPRVAPAFEQRLELAGITFAVKSANTRVGNVVSITPSGLAIDNTALSMAVQGIVRGAEVGDINADGSPELYVYVSRSGPGDRGGLIAFSANDRKSLSSIHLPPVEEDRAISRGYRGRDEFAVVEGILARRFPIFSDDPAAVAPTGKMRQLQYKLVRGEAGWLLRLDRVVEF